MFDWLNQLVEFALSVFPRLFIIRATHQGVKWRHGKNVRLLRAGLHVYWPLLTEVELIVVARQPINFPIQVLTTKDGYTVVVGAIAVYSIEDAVLAIGEKNWDVDSTIRDVGQASIVSVITRSKLDTLLEGMSNRRSPVNRQLTLSCRKQLREYGVNVHRCGLTDFAVTRVYRLVGNDPFRESGE